MRWLGMAPLVAVAACAPATVVDRHERQTEGELQFICVHGGLYWRPSFSGLSYVPVVIPNTYGEIERCG